MKFRFVLIEMFCMTLKNLQQVVLFKCAFDKCKPNCNFLHPPHTTIVYFNKTMMYYFLFHEPLDS